MRTLKKVKSISLKMLIWMASISISIISGNAYASVIQAHTPAVIFAASCATCHGGAGLGGVSFVKNGPTDDRVAPKIAGKPTAFIVSMVRNGSNNGAMPAFGPEEITNAELQALAVWLKATPAGVSAPTPPSGTPVRLDILDADPWYSDHGADSALDLRNDIRRVALGANQYLKVVNTGRTWHTLTDSKNGKDSGFIGYAGNYNDAVGDLGQIGYYNADQTTGLTTGCHRYLCKLHPYMQVEVCTAGAVGAQVVDNAPVGGPAGPEDPLGLTRAHKHAMAVPPVAGVGAVWVTAQSQEEAGETGTGTVTNDSVTDMDGSYQVIDANTTAWGVTRIQNVGNNPHNAWPGKNAAGDDVVLSANWHDNSVTLMDANSPYAILGERRSGAASAHIQVSPQDPDRFYVTHMGGAALQRIDVDRLDIGLDPNVGGTIKGATAPHGLWFCGDGVHVMTADTLGNSATLYNINLQTSVTVSSGGKAPLAPALFSGVGNGCSRGFTNNALSADVSVYNINPTPGAEGIARNTTWTASSANGLYKNAAGNIQLRNITADQAASPIVPEAINQARWVHLPVQTPVSPAAKVGEVLTHGRYMVTANKASFNVSVTKLDPATGDPVATYSFPAGLGAHGVTYGKKSSCSNPSSVPGGNTCYYAYVTNTFEDYISVYDLEQMETGGAMGAAGSALLAESVYVEGGAVAAVRALDPVVAGLCDVADYVGGQLVYDLNPGTNNFAGDDDGTLVGTVGAFIGYDFANHLKCGVGAMNTASLGTLSNGSPIPIDVVLYVANLPIGVLCPDCRSGVHVGDIPMSFTGASGAPLGGTSTGALTLTATGASPTDVTPGSTKYTYLKEEVWVDTDTISCTINTLVAGVGNSLALNDCNLLGTTNGAFGGNTTSPGVLNKAFEFDLWLGINTGTQGIVASPAAAPW